MADSDLRKAQRQRVLEGSLDTLARLHAARRTGRGWWKRRCRECRGLYYKQPAELPPIARVFCSACDSTGKQEIPIEDFIYLLAFCGDKDAREKSPDWRNRLLKERLQNKDEPGLPKQWWDRDLARWDPDLPAVALISVARAAFRPATRGRNCDGTGKRPRLNHYDNTPTGDYWDSPCYCCRRERTALEAAEDWRDRGGEKDQVLECRNVENRLDGGDHLKDGLSRLLFAIIGLPYTVRCANGDSCHERAMRHFKHCFPPSVAETHAREGVLKHLQNSIEDIR